MLPGKPERSARSQGWGVPSRENLMLMLLDRFWQSPFSGRWAVPVDLCVFRAVGSYGASLEAGTAVMGLDCMGSRDGAGEGRPQAAVTSSHPLQSSHPSFFLWLLPGRGGWLRGGGGLGLDGSCSSVRHLFLIFGNLAPFRRTCSLQPAMH